MKALSTAHLEQKNDLEIFASPVFDREHLESRENVGAHQESTIARLRTEHLKGMKIHPDKTRSYVQCKHCPDLQLTPNHVLECPTVATKLLKMGMVPLRDSLRELLYSPDAPRIAEAVIKTFDGI
ncbi:hypothetical protein TNCV_3488041 [Trichonephila clavipes]|nr:hypothetical protein TNCV_3488041 [Trichonephila clavipes]